MSFIEESSSFNEEPNNSNASSDVNTSNDLKDILRKIMNGNSTQTYNRLYFINQKNAINKYLEKCNAGYTALLKWMISINEKWFKEEDLTYFSKLLECTIKEMEFQLHEGIENPSLDYVNDYLPYFIKLYCEETSEISQSFIGWLIQYPRCYISEYSFRESFIEWMDILILFTEESKFNESFIKESESMKKTFLNNIHLIFQTEEEEEWTKEDLSKFLEASICFFYLPDESSSDVLMQKLESYEELEINERYEELEIYESYDLINIKKFISLIYQNESCS